MSKDTCWSRCLCGLALLLAETEAAHAQLTSEDIEALPERGKELGWTFTGGRNPATKCPLDDLCGLVAPDKWLAGVRFDPCAPRLGLR